MPLGYSLKLWKLCLPHSNLGSSRRDCFSFPALTQNSWVPVMQVTAAWLQHLPSCWGLLKPRITSGQRLREQSLKGTSHSICSSCALLACDSSANLLSFHLEHWCCKEGPGAALQHMLLLAYSSWLQQMFLLFKVAGTFLVIFLPSSWPHANPSRVDIWKQAFRLWPRPQHAVIQCLTDDWFPETSV